MNLNIKCNEEIGNLIKWLCIKGYIVKVTETCRRSVPIINILKDDGTVKHQFNTSYYQNKELISLDGKYKIDLKENYNCVFMIEKI